MRNIRVTVLLVEAFAAAATVTAALLPGVDFATTVPWLRLAINVAPPLFALATAFLVIGRLRRRARLNELILACSLGTLARSGLAFVTVPLLLQRFWPDLSVWAALAGSALGAVLFGLAVFAPRRRLRRLGLALASTGAEVTTALLLITVLAAAFAAGTLAGPDLHPDAVLRAAEITVAAIYGLTAAGFLRRFRRLHDAYFGLLAICAVIAAAAHVNYFPHTALYLHFVSVGNLFLLGFYVMLMGGSARESWSYWRAVPEAAVLAERRRIARDLHDGPAQDLAYLLRNIGSLNGKVDQETKEHQRRAAQRAEFDVRLAIDAITAPRSTSVNAAIAQAVGQVAARDHITLGLNLAPGIRLSLAPADVLVWTACEAANNAVRHSGAAQVSLSLQHQGLSVRLRVTDNGSGFDTLAQADGFGLTSMREHATSVGGDLRISSVPGHGTEAEVKL